MVAGTGLSLFALCELLVSLGKEEEAVGGSTGGICRRGNIRLVSVFLGVG